MANEYKLSYTADEIDRRLGNVSQLSENVDVLNTDVGTMHTDIGVLQTDIQNKAEIMTLSTAEYEALEETNANTLYMLTDAEEETVDAVLYTGQTLTEEQKSQARMNIGINETIADTLMSLDIISTIPDEDGSLGESDSTLLVVRNDDIFLPEVTDENNGGALRVVDGRWEIVGNLADQQYVDNAIINHKHTIDNIDGLQEAVNNAADSKFYVVTFDKGSDNEYHADLTFAEIREKFEAGGNMVARIDGTDYIPLLSVASHQIIFSGIYQAQSVSLTINSSDVCELTTTSLVQNSNLASHINDTSNPHNVTCEQIGALPNTTVIPDAVVNPATATVGQTIVVKTVDENSKPTEWECVDVQSQVQADLSQNDSTRPDYVKNRTHWINHAETLLDSEVFECTTLTEDSESYYCVKSGNIGLVNGNKYNVTVDGIEYTVSALTAFGTNDIALIANIDKCRIYDRESGVVEVFTDSSASLTISIVDAEDIYVKLDERFIPDIFARSTDIEQKMAKENPTGYGALSINRASGSEIGENSVAIGTDCIASGASAIAIGSGVSATGFASHAEGTGTVASGNLAHAEGQDSKATGYASHAESSGEANGDYSHAEGYGIADGNYSHASGNGTWAVGRSQTVIGEANLEDAAVDAATRGTYAVIVGNGDMDAGEYSNASTLDWDGNAWFAGDIFVGSTSGTNKDEGSVKLQRAITGIVGQVVGFDDNGNAIAQDAPEPSITTAIDDGAGNVTLESNSGIAYIEDALKQELINAVLASLNTETLTFTLDDGTIVTKEVVVL